MMGITIVTALLVLASLQSVQKSETVTFKASPAVHGFYDYYPKITAKICKPQGTGPFPAVVLIHGTQGISEHHQRWLEILSGWGYVALLVDSIEMRARLNPKLDPITITLEEFMQDAYDAKSYLCSLPYVNRQKIAVMGWEKGGWAILDEARGEINVHSQGVPFQASVMIYPYCWGFLDVTKSPLLVLMGGKDRWCPPGRCAIAPERKGKHELLLKVYEGAYHAFDVEGMDRIFRGHQLLYDNECAEDAVERIKRFLRKYLR